MIVILNKKFFDRDTIRVARGLLGKKLVRMYREKRIEGIITEVEAYIGFEDKASHASRGKTERTKVMFAGAGTIYVYLIYGMHFCLNIVTEREEYPAAVLIRGIKTKDGLISGPGRVTKYIRIDKKLNEKILSVKNGLWIENREKFNSKKIFKSKRIGVDYAGSVWAKKLWRFYISRDKS